MVNSLAEDKKVASLVVATNQASVLTVNCDGEEGCLDLMLSTALDTGVVVHNNHTGISVSDVKYVDGYGENYNGTQKRPIDSGRRHKQLNWEIGGLRGIR